jgi:hypothetical protein
MEICVPLNATGQVSVPQDRPPRVGTRPHARLNFFRPTSPIGAAIPVGCKPARFAKLLSFAKIRLTSDFNALPFANIICETGGENGTSRLCQGEHPGPEP